MPLSHFLCCWRQVRTVAALGGKPGKAHDHPTADPTLPREAATAAGAGEAERGESGGDGRGETKRGGDKGGGDEDSDDDMRESLGIAKAGSRGKARTGSQDGAQQRQQQEEKDVAVAMKGVGHGVHEVKDAQQEQKEGKRGPQQQEKAVMKTKRDETVGGTKIQEHAKKEGPLPVVRADEIL